jgi:hypothetical protein
LPSTENCTLTDKNVPIPLKKKKRRARRNKKEGAKKKKEAPKNEAKYFLNFGVKNF